MSDEKESMGEAHFNLNIQIMKELAEAAAHSAAQQIAREVREEMRDEHGKLKKELIHEVRKEIKAYHGDMTPTEHAVQHERMDRFLGLMDKMNQSFWGQMLSGVVKWAIMIFLIGYFVWTQGGGSVAKSAGGG